MPSFPENSRPTILVLLGPTGSGKTDLVASLDPERHEVVSCDSRQVYRELEIGTAAPEPEVLERMPHHLVGILSPAESIDAARYAEQARRAFLDILERGKTPVLAGGAGFYYRAIKTGLFDSPRDPEIREQVALLSREEKYARLQELDPNCLQAEHSPSIPGRIHPHDDYRLGRALETALSGGPVWSELWREAEKRADSGEFRFQGWVLTVPPEEYESNLRLRAEMMIDLGLLAETERALKKYGDFCPGLKTLGYNFAIDALQGRMNIAELLDALYTAHRRYGKRQRTWFRRETDLIPLNREELAREFEKRNQK